MVCVGSTTPPQTKDRGAVYCSGVWRGCKVRLGRSLHKTIANSYVCPLSSSSTPRCFKWPRCSPRFLVPVGVGVKRNFVDVGKVHVDGFMARYGRRQRHVYISWLLSLNHGKFHCSKANFNLRPECWQLKKWSDVILGSCARQQLVSGRKSTSNVFLMQCITVNLVVPLLFWKCAILSFGQVSPPKSGLWYKDIRLLWITTV